MNIFVTDDCPFVCAIALDNRRLVKMILETAQLLSTALSKYISSELYEEFKLYKPTHVKHPCTLWASLNRSNFKWLLSHLKFLGQEYTYRYNKVHKSMGLYNAFERLVDNIPVGDLTKFANCTRVLGKVDYRDMEDVCLAYRRYMIYKWKNDNLVPKWGCREIPNWYKSV